MRSDKQKIKSKKNTENYREEKDIFGKTKKTENYTAWRT